MSWTKLEPLTEPVRNGCLHCPPKPIELPLDCNPHPGFGMLMLTRDGDPLDVPDIADDTAIERYLVQDHEDIAAGDPDHDWRIVIDGPLSGVTYQRQGEGVWLAIDKNMGFA